MQVKANYEERREQIDSTVEKLVEQWNNEDYFAAGESFANFWGAMIGKPDLTMAPEEMDAESMPKMSEHPLADFYGAGFVELWNQDWNEEINKCLIFDDLEITAWSFALNALNPYDEFNWMKYFYTISTLDKFNWGPCMEVKGLNTLIEKNNKWWDDFWSKPDAKEKME